MYWLGFIAAILAILLSELIWLPAPLVLGNGMHWIEIIDWLYYGLLLIPLLWLAGAWQGLRQLRSLGAAKGAAAASHTLIYILIIVRYLIMTLSVAVIILLALPSKPYNWLIIAAIPLVLLVISDIVIGSAGTARQLWTSIGKLAAVALLLSFIIVPTRYEVTYPGMTLDMNRYAAIEGGRATGAVDGVLVFDRPAVLADWLFARLFPQYEISKIPDNEPPLSEQFAQVIAMKRDANQLAAAIALQKTGKGAGVIADGVRVAGILKDSPADGKLQAGDIIVAINDHAVLTSEAMQQYMKENVKPGDTIQIEVRRSTAGEAVAIKLIAAGSPDDQSRAVVGVTIQTEVKLDAPVPIAYNQYLAHLGGPSHGAMLTLALIDQLTPGGVLHQIQVAGTGTIELDGSVGMVGGIPQKAYAVSRTGAEVFFVPVEGEAAARKAAPKLNIVPVATIDDILAWLEANHK